MKSNDSIEVFTSWAQGVTSIDIKRRLTREAEHKISGVALITCVYIKVLHALFSGLFIRTMLYITICSV